MIRTDEQSTNPVVSPATTTSSNRSEELLARARKCIAGGDSSTMRVLPYQKPLVAERGEGPYVFDADGNRFIDLNMAYGPLLFGHRPECISRRVTEQITQYGSQLGFPAEINTRVAEKIKSLFPGMELLRFANSGTEADASAIRLARVATGRQKIIVFEGHYHGWSDALFHRYHAPLGDLPACGFGPAIPGTAGMAGAPLDTIAVRWNDIDVLSCCIEQHGPDIAACIMEPVMGNAGVIAPQRGYLSAVRELTRQHGMLLIYDEVITGLRISSGGAQSMFQVKPDITVISKALGGGYPVAAFGASADLMQHIVDGTLFHGGVYSSNATVMAAAEAVLDEVIAGGDEMYDHLYAIGNQLAAGIRAICDRHGLPAVVQNVGPMIAAFLTDGQIDSITQYRQVRQHCDFEKFIRLQHLLQDMGVFFHPNQFEPMYLSIVHTPEVIDNALDRFEDGIRCLVG